jgi:ABC-type nickel/cobalt efflux system permease component RcnA
MVVVTAVAFVVAVFSADFVLAVTAVVAVFAVALVVAVFAVDFMFTVTAVLVLAFVFVVALAVVAVVLAVLDELCDRHATGSRSFERHELTPEWHRRPRVEDGGRERLGEDPRRDQDVRVRGGADRLETELAKILAPEQPRALGRREQCAPGHAHRRAPSRQA